MKILLYGLNFAPELTGIGKYTGEMTAWLAARGHEVRVVRTLCCACVSTVKLSFDNHCYFYYSRFVHGTIAAFKKRS